ncbi:MAG: SurA N-terminal domain-containing protein [Salaquimonas sp.]
MLTMLRNATKGWTAKILLLLLVASFAVWGVSGSMLQGVGNYVVAVGDTKVGLVEYRLAYDRQVNQLQRQFGTRISREQADAFGVSGNVIAQLVSGALLDESSRDMGLGISKDKLATLIGDDDSFRDATGQFSRGQLQQVLRSVGMSEEQYVQTREAVAVRNQLIEGTVGKADLPDTYWDLLAKYQSEERTFQFVTISNEDIAAITDATDEQVKTYYEANLDKYGAPEFRKLSIVKLEAADIADESSVSQEEIETDYESRKANFSSPEKRDIQQLVFTDAAKAEAALEALKTGSTFEQVLESEGKTVNDVALGVLAKSDIPDPKVAEAAFGLSANETSELIDGLFGKVILRVVSIEQGSTKPLSEVEGEIRKAIALTHAANEIFETHDKLEDERAAGEPLATAASNVGLKVRVVDAIDRTARDMDGNIINDIPQSRDLLAAAFDIDEGVEADPISIGTDGFVWFEVDDIINERQKSFDEVKDQVKSDWLAEEKTAAVVALTEKIRERVSSGEDFNTVIGELLPSAEGAPVRLAQQTAAIKRDGEAIGLPQTAIVAAFNIPQGSALAEIGTREDQRVVVKVERIETGTVEPVTATDKEQLQNLLSDDLVNQMVTRLQQDQEVEINQQAISNAFATGGYGS